MAIQVVSCECANARNDTRKEPTLALDDNCVTLIPDSVRIKAPILPDDYFLKENNIRSIPGWEFSPQLEEELVFSDLGILIPKGFTISRKEFRARLLSSSRLYLVGRWNMMDSVDCYLIKSVNTKESGVIIYILTVKDNVYIDAAEIAYADEQYHHPAPGPVLPERVDPNKILVHFQKPTYAKSGDVLYRVTPEGRIKGTNP